MNRARCFLLMLAGILSVAGAVPAAPPQSVNHSLSCDGIRVNVGGNALMTVAVDGVPFISSTDFAAVKPGWKGTWYTTNHDYTLMSRGSVARSADGSGTVTLPMLPREGGFEGTMTLTLMSGRRLGVAVDAVTTSEPAGLMEGRVAAIFGGWIAGRPYTASFDGGTSTGVLPAVCPSEKLAESILVREFRKLEVDTRGGPLTVTVEGNAPVSLVDYRMNNYANNLPIYWMGPLERKVTPGERVRFSVLFQIPPATRQAGPTIEARKALALKRDAVAPDAPADRIIPTPKKVEWRPDDLRLRDGARIAVSSADVLPAAQQFAAFALNEYGLSLSVAETPPGEPEPQGTIRVRLGRTDVSFPKSESYAMLITADGAEVDAPTSAGALHAMRTLRQLLRARDGKVFLRACSVDDWPAFPYRGVHMFGGPNSVPFVTRIIGEVLGPLKMNEFHFQCEYIRWDAHPELWNPKRGMEKAEAAEIATAAHREAMALTPLINTFGHSNWLFNGDAHRDLADNPDNPNTYDPSNPEVYRIAAAVYDEAIVLFNPATFNIGHDEIGMYGFPESAANRKAGTGELIRRDIKYYHDYLTTQGIRTMLWSDQFLAPGDASSAAFAPSTTESKARRNALPKDVIIADWHYTPVPPDQYKSIGLWSREGFDAVVCPWDKPGNIVAFAKAAALAREEWAKDPAQRGEPMGLLQTTWAGFVNDEKAFLTNPEQFAAYLLAAECAWSGGYDNPSQVPFDYVDEFTRLWRRRVLPRAGAEGWQINLSDVANLELASTKTAQWLGYWTPPRWQSCPPARCGWAGFRCWFPARRARPARCCSPASSILRATARGRRAWYSRSGATRIRSPWRWVPPPIRHPSRPLRAPYSGMTTARAPRWSSAWDKTSSPSPTQHRA